MDKTYCLGERGVFLKDLGEPGPEDNDVAILSDSFGNGEPVKEIGGQNVGELHRVGGDGRVREVTAFGGNNALQATADAATKLYRESARERLVFGHTGSNSSGGFPATLSS